MNSQITTKRIWLSAAFGLAFLILFAHPQTAVAQQWTSNGAHISNANSGNVGIGTGASNPGAKLDILIYWLISSAAGFIQSELKEIAQKTAIRSMSFILAVGRSTNFREEQPRRSPILQALRE